MDCFRIILQVLKLSKNGRLREKSPFSCYSSISPIFHLYQFAFRYIRIVRRERFPSRSDLGQRLRPVPTYCLIFDGKLVLRLVFVLILVFSILSTALADDDSLKELTLEEIIVTATRSPAELSKVSAFGTVISKAQINKYATNNIGELLGSADFVQVMDYGPSSLSALSVRGASNSQVLVLMDGERINNAQNGFADFDKISLDGIKRIEVVRGGQSALYGADATGGIINIITEDSDKNQIRLGTEAGALGYLLWNASIKRKFDTVSGMISYSHNQYEGDFEFQDKFDEIRIRENADYLKRNAFAKIEWNPREVTNIVVSGRHSYADNGDPGPLGQYSPAAFVKEVTNSIQINLKEQIKENWKYESMLFGRNSKQHYFNPNGFPQIDDSHKLRSIGGRLQTQFLPKKSMPFTAGISVRGEELSSTSVGEKERTSVGVYLQQELELEYKSQAVYVYPALRFDGYSDFDAGLSPKIGMLIDLFDSLVGIKGNVGSSYRAPTMNDLYWPEDAFAKGNPELKPERSEDFDVGIELKSPKSETTQINLGVAYFRNDYTDLIEWAPDSTRKWTPTNRSKAEIKGIESNLGLSITNFLSIGVSYTSLEALDSNGRQLMYRPIDFGNYHVNIGKQNLWMQIEGKYQGKRYYTRENTKWLKPFYVHNLRIGLSRNIMERVKMIEVLEIRNLFDVDYQLIADYPLPSRQWRFKVMFEF